MDVRSNVRREIKKPLIYLNDQTLIEISRKSPFLRDINPRCIYVLFALRILRIWHQLITLARCAKMDYNLLF